MNFKKLNIYNKAVVLLKKSYELINNNSRLAKDFALHDQLKRAAISIILNIAEGNLRTLKLSKNYLRISVGSCNEVLAILDIINNIYQIDTKELSRDYEILAKQIMAFINSFDRIKK